MSVIKVSQRNLLSVYMFSRGDIWPGHGSTIPFELWFLSSVREDCDFPESSLFFSGDPNKVSTRSLVSSPDIRSKDQRIYLKFSIEYDKPGVLTT